MDEEEQSQTMPDVVWESIYGAIDACGGSGEVLDGAIAVRQTDGSTAVILQDGRAYLIVTKPAHLTVANSAD